nr:rho GTPase-activating protein 26-like [Salvelinus alpinus]
MGLPALEFSDCYLDSPQFRDRLKSHELELDKTNKFIKELIKDGKALIQALKNLSTAKRKFAESLNEFKFQCIGDAETDDEICIGELALRSFCVVTDCCISAQIENANDVLIMPLERFRKEQISAAKEAKKKYDKETEKYCAVLEKHLSLSAKKKEAHLHEADSQVDHVRQHFYEVSLEYVFKVQEVQERKMFDFVEPTRNRFESTRSEVECLMRKMKENPHEHKSISHDTMEGYLFVQEKRSLCQPGQVLLHLPSRPKRVTMVLFDQNLEGEEESFTLKSCTRRKTDSIEKRFCFDVEGVDRSSQSSSLSCSGAAQKYPSCPEQPESPSCPEAAKSAPPVRKRARVASCPSSQSRPSSLSGARCDGGPRSRGRRSFRKPLESVGSIGGRPQAVVSPLMPMYCFTTRRPGSLTYCVQQCFITAWCTWAYVSTAWVQYTDRCLRLVVLAVKLSGVTVVTGRFCSFQVYNLNRDSQSEGMVQLDVVGFNVVKKFIYAVETRGIDEQGLYRIVGVNSRVQNLLGLAMGKTEISEREREATTLCLSLCLPLCPSLTLCLLSSHRMLPAPLMTYQYQRSFIKAAKRDNQEARITEIHSIVHWLPEKNRQMLDLLTKHLANVASHHQQNLMTVANLGVVFGPTLLRPQEETVAAIMDIKFQNIVVEILIENHERIFKDMPVPGGGPANLQLNLQPRRRSTESKAPSCSERPLTLFHTPTHSQKVEERNSVVVNSTLELQQPQPAQAKAPHNNPSATPSSSAAVNHNSSGSHSHSWTPRNSLTSTDGDQDRGLTARQNSQSRPNSLLNPKSRTSIPTSPASPSPTSPRSPSWPMFSASSSPQPASSTSSDSSPISIPGRQARALYACKAEHHSELSFIAGTTFENGEYGSL